MSYNEIVKAYNEMSEHYSAIYNQPWFLNQLANFYNVDVSSIDMKDIDMMKAGMPTRFWKAPGKYKTFVTVAMRYKHDLVFYEQDTLEDQNGVFRLQS